MSGSRWHSIRWILHRAGLLAVLAVAGCDRGLDTEYAAIRGRSINGVSAFMNLLREAGLATTGRQSLPTRIPAEYDVVVVFDHAFGGLSPDAAERLEDFLDQDRPGTLLLVPRDSDGVIAYLRDLLAGAALTAGQRTTAGRQLELAEAKLMGQTGVPRPAANRFPDALVAPTATRDGEAVEVRSRLAGPGSRRIEARWPLARRLAPGSAVRTLWETESEPLLVRQTRGEDTVLVLASAAPLLNGGLVDPGNRRLAEELVSLLPSDGRVLVVGSSRLPDGDVGSEDGEERSTEPWHRLFAVQPLPWVLAQALLAMGLFCWHTAPIFGRPRQPGQAGVQDFSHHVEALAGLLSRGPGAGADFCGRRLAAWRQATAASGSCRRRRA